MRQETDKQICEYLKIPKCPKKKWDKESSFIFGVAAVNRITDEVGYAVCRFDKEKDDAPRIIKDFNPIPFNRIIEVYPIPSYLDQETEKVDLDEKSKEAAKALVEEQKTLVEGLEDKKVDEIPEWGYEEIHNKEEGLAFLKTKNLKGKLPTREEAIKAKLVLLRSEDDKQNK